MKKVTVVVALATLLLGIAPAVADDDMGMEPTKFKWFGTLRVRPEYQDNLTDLDTGRDDKIWINGYRANLGFSVDLDKNVSVLFDGQVLGNWGENGTPINGTQTVDNTAAKFNFVQAYVQAKDIFGTPFSLRVGRQKLVFGDGWLLGDLDFYGGTSWDGLRGDWAVGEDAGTVTVFAMQGSETDSPEFNAASVTNSGDLGGDFQLYGAWTDWNLSERQTFDAALIYWFDHRKTASSVIGAPAFGFTDKRTTFTLDYMFGGDTGGFVKGYAAVQRGQAVNFSLTDTVDVDANAFEVKGGWTWEFDGRKSKVYGRLAHFSGDDINTSDNEAFNPMTQNFHNRYGYTDFWNGIWGRQSYIGGSPGLDLFQIGFYSELKNGIRVKGIAQTQRRSEKISSGGEIRALGQEYGIGAEYDYGKHVTLEIVYAQLYPGTAFTFEPPLFTKSNARRAYINGIVRF